jgi:hypothetical protein
MSHAPPDIRLNPETFFERPDVYPLEFDRGRVTLVPMTRETYQQSTFLDRNRIVPADREGWHLPLMGLLAEFEQRQPAPQPLRFIFHIAHCGSTLLSRALDVPGRTLVLREPYTLRQLGAEFTAASGDSSREEHWRRCVAFVAALLGRRYASDEPVIVKANVPVNFMLEPLLDMRPDARGVLLYCGFERYVLSVLKTPMHQRWVGNVSAELAGGIRSTPGLGQAALDGLSAGAAAACLWVAQMRRFQAISADAPALLGLDCEVFFTRPIETLNSIANHFGIDIPDSDFESAAADGLFDRHGKDPRRAYDRQTRERELGVLRERLRAELSAARTWLDANGIDETRLAPASDLATAAAGEPRESHSRLQPNSR